jgi:phosphatidylserine/phosphatidylglycerophosphate/cardiolipin synthase-like enzyme
MRFSAVVLATTLCLGFTANAFAKADMEVGFSPPNGGTSALDVVLNGVTHAQHQILVAAYSFTSKPIAMALVDAKQRGVEVRVVADKKANGGKYSAVTFLANKGVPVRLNGHYAIMHNKFMVIDGQDVETGSFNYTQAAAKSNAENALLLHGVPDMASTYTRDFKKLWDEADALEANY